MDRMAKNQMNRMDNAEGIGMDSDDDMYSEHKQDVKSVATPNLDALNVSLQGSRCDDDHSMDNIGNLVTNHQHNGYEDDMYGPGTPEDIDVSKRTPCSSTRTKSAIFTMGAIDEIRAFDEPLENDEPLEGDETIAVDSWMYNGYLE